MNSHDKALAGVTAVICLSYLAISLWCLVRVIQNRRCLHVVNRDLGLIVTSNLTLSLGVVANASSIIAKALQWTSTYPTIKTLICLSLMNLVILSADIIFKLNTVVLKFKDKLAEDGGGKLGLHLYHFDLRTAKNKRVYVLTAITLAILFGILVVVENDHLCLYICKQELPPMSSQWFLTTPALAPIAFIFWTTAWELARLGPVEESLGIMQEMRTIGQWAPVPCAISPTLLFLLDFRVIQGQQWSEVVIAMAGIFLFSIMLYASHVSLTPLQGYGLFFSSSSSCSTVAGSGITTTTITMMMKRGSSSSARVAPMLNEEWLSTKTRLSSGHSFNDSYKERDGNDGDGSGDDDEEDGMGLGEPSTANPVVVAVVDNAVTTTTTTTNGNLPCWYSKDIDLSIVLESLSGDEDMLTRLYRVAKRLLSYEVVRCTVAIVGLKSLSLKSKEDREEMREVWKGIMANHLAEGAPLPIAISERRRQATFAMLQQASRRKTLFADDCKQVNACLEEVAEKLSTVVRPVITSFMRAYGNDYARRVMGLSCANAVTGATMTMTMTMVGGTTQALQSGSGSNKIVRQGSLPSTAATTREKRRSWQKQQQQPLPPVEQRKEKGDDGDGDGGDEGKPPPQQEEEEEEERGDGDGRQQEQQQKEQQQQQQRQHEEEKKGDDHADKQQQQQQQKEEKEPPPQQRQHPEAEAQLPAQQQQDGPPALLVEGRRTAHQVAEQQQPPGDEKEKKEEKEKRPSRPSQQRPGRQEEEGEERGEEEEDDDDTTKRQAAGGPQSQVLEAA